MNKSVMDLKYLLQSDYIILDGFRTTKDIIQEHYANIKAGMVDLSGLAVHQADELLKALSSIPADYIDPSNKTITLTSYEFALMVDVWKAADHNFKNVSLLEDCETFNNIAAKLGII